MIMIRRGTALIETVLSAALLLLVCLYGLECFGLARRVFVGLKAAQEEDLAAAVAIESLRRDAARAGEGLGVSIGLGLLSGAELTPGGFLVRFAGAQERLSEDVVPGQTRIRFDEAGSFDPGREICLCADDRCEVRTVTAAGTGWIVVDEGAAYAYGREDARVFAVETVEARLDRTARVLRRRVNGGAGQPLLEEAAAFEVDWTPAPPLVRFRIVLNSKRDKTYEASVVPKNLAFAPRLPE
jgi:hypothetical protein